MVNIVQKRANVPRFARCTPWKTWLSPRGTPRNVLKKPSFFAHWSSFIFEITKVADGFTGLS